MGLQMIPLLLFTFWALIKGYATHPAGFSPDPLLVVLHDSHVGQRPRRWRRAGRLPVLGLGHRAGRQRGERGLAHHAGRLGGPQHAHPGRHVRADHGRHAGLPRRRPSWPTTPATSSARIAHDVMGGTWDKLVFLCIFTSGAASALTTLLPLTRQTLSMAAHKSLPKIFGRIHPKYMTPFWGTVILGTLSILWYVLADLVERQCPLRRHLGDRHHGLHRLRRHRPGGHRLLPQGAPQERQELLPDGRRADGRSDHVRRDPHQGALRRLSYTAATARATPASTASAASS